ncbi:TOMM precursor leader peptide-binding protein [Microbacterium sediminicola]|uniref:TOMM leader peptide-binding protein n=1 Tax=Microbacterium sediminicola TaxID=415210 RepID=A0ABN2HM79_9MICO
MTLARPRFKPQYHPFHFGKEGTLLLTEGGPIALNGAAFSRVCPLIDGERSASQIVADLAGTISGAQVYFALATLERRGYLEDADAQLAPSGERAYWWRREVDPALASTRLSEMTVSVIAVGEVDLAAMIDALRSAGVHVGDEGDLTVVVVDDYRRPELGSIARAHAERAVPWILVKPEALSGWIGPAFLPRTEASWQGLIDRIRLNFATDAFVEDVTGSTPITASGPSAATPAVRAMFATEIAGWIGSAGATELTGSLLSIDTVTWERTWHSVTYPPRFVSGMHSDEVLPETTREPQPMEFSSSPLTSDPGGHRALTVDEALARFGHLVSPITGVVGGLQRITADDDTLMHTYASSHNWATHADSLAFLRSSLRSQSGGKGTSDAQAKMGALGEAVERYSGVYRGNEIRRFGLLSDFAPNVVDPREIMLFSDAQYERRRETNASGNALQTVPEVFDPELPTDWSPMWSPTAQEHVWVPTGLLYYNYSRFAPQDAPNRRSFYADSNGCAAGSTIAEAALQGLLELVERDAVATWWYSRVRRPALRLEDFMTDYLRQLIDWLDTNGRDFWLIDVTNDIGIPVVAACAPRRDAAPDESDQIILGFGAHLDPHVAVLRAATEATQFFAALSTIDEGDLHKAFDPGATEWWRTATVESEPYLVPSGEQRRHSDFATLTGDDLATEVQTTIDLIEARGPRVLLLDQSRPDTGMAVVKALAPGLRHFWDRRAPGRLYDTPVELGWLAEPLSESDLNPTPVFF